MNLNLVSNDNCNSVRLSYSKAKSKLERWLINPRIC